MQKEIILAAGCFWGVQALFDQINGIISTEAGYIGGTMSTPSYQSVCTGNTNHAEAVRINYDESEVSTNEILDIFFQNHNPTTLNRQGSDFGTQYRSAIFFTTRDQKKAALKKIREYSTYFDQPIVTQVQESLPFYSAEEYHQKYLEKRGQNTCHRASNMTQKMWKKKLSTEQYHVLREKGTELPHSGKYVLFDENGTYRCVACGQRLFESNHKFNSGYGWPSFDEAIKGSIQTKKDFSHFMIRNEVVCSRCDSHLGHIFKDGPTQTGNRFCINSVALEHTPSKQQGK